MTVLLGGARAGKSSVALELARRWDGGVAFVATAEAGDEEMAARIARHRSERPESWTTVEEPLELLHTIEGLPTQLVVVDCLTLWVANLLGRGDGAHAVEAEAERVASALAWRNAPSIVVTNEVGLGVVPPTPLGREYRDVLGGVNRTFVAHSTRAALVVAGRLLPLDRVEW
jgi:adenosyl cobinamide kinase/adenosyl cobinamide phosphate guanylyltransferase